MTPAQNVALDAMNTLAVPALAEYFYRAGSVAEVQAALVWLKQRACPLFILGEGSNVVLAPQLSGLVLVPQIAGRTAVDQPGDQVLVTLGAGENWHSVVQWSLAQGFYGLENLALIPGSVGAAPVQNIGAYGVELCQVFEQLQAVDLRTGDLVTFTAAQCGFSYRDSVFKSAARGRYLITQVTLRLWRAPRLNLSYPALRESLAEDGKNATPEAVFAAVCALRQAKLPDPSVTPNCGSFFKNPVVAYAQWQQLQQQHPDLAAFDVPPDPVLGKVKKLAAAWLIDRAGWKGRDWHGVVVHPRQALVLTNPQRCSGAQVLAAAQAIAEDVQRQFGVTLEREPQCLGWD